MCVCVCVCVCVCAHVHTCMCVHMHVSVCVYVCVCVCVFDPCSLHFTYLTNQQIPLTFYSSQKLLYMQRTISNSFNCFCISIIRDQGIFGAVEVSWEMRTLQGTPVPEGSEFEATNGTVVFQPQEAQQALGITPLADEEPEGLETFRVVLTSVRGTPSLELGGGEEEGGGLSCWCFMPSRLALSPQGHQRRGGGGGMEKGRACYRRVGGVGRGRELGAWEGKGGRQGKRAPKLSWQGGGWGEGESWGHGRGREGDRGRRHQS